MKQQRLYRSRKRHHDEQQDNSHLLNQKSSVATQQASVMPAHQLNILNMQENLGNSYVQRLIQREAEGQDKELELERQTRDQEQLEETEVEMNLPAELTDRGGINMDLSKLLDLRKFGPAGKALADQIDEWGGMGLMWLDNDSEFPVQKIEATNQGKMEMELHPSFQKFIEATFKGVNPTQKPEWNRMLGKGLKIKATMHTNLEDPDLSDTELDLSPQKFGGRPELPVPIMYLEIEGEIGQGILPKPFKFEGQWLLQPILKDQPPEL